MSGWRRGLALWLCPDLAPQLPPDAVAEAQIVDLIRALAKARGWSVSHASRMASGSGDTVDRLEAGIGMTLRRANAVTQRCADLWPTEAKSGWPKGVQRPPKQKKGEVA